MIGNASYRQQEHNTMENIVENHRVFLKTHEVGVGGCGEEQNMSWFSRPHFASLLLQNITSVSSNETMLIPGPAISHPLSASLPAAF